MMSARKRAKLAPHRATKGGLVHSPAQVNHRPRLPHICKPVVVFFRFDQGPQLNRADPKSSVSIVGRQRSTISFPFHSRIKALKRFATLLEQDLIGNCVTEVEEERLIYNYRLCTCITPSIF